MTPPLNKYHPVLVHTVGPGDIEPLYEYLSGLSEESRHRFGPHSFDKETLKSLFAEPGNHIGYVSHDNETRVIIAYSIIRIGYLEHERLRLESYGLTLDPDTDVTYAPSVADDWQGRGIGPQLYDYMAGDLAARGIRRIILWGGVQCGNLRAVNFYRRLGFNIMGEFEYYGMNYDMMKEITI